MAKEKASNPDSFSSAFDEVIQIALDGSLARRRAAKDRRARDKADHDYRFASGVAALKLALLPMLIAARDGFGERGIGSEIEDNFEETGAAQPWLSLHCCAGPAEQDQGSARYAVGRSAVFHHDGESFFVGFAKSYSKRAENPVRIEGDILAAVIKAVETVAESYFRDLERRQTG